MRSIQPLLCSVCLVTRAAFAGSMQQLDACKVCQVDAVVSHAVHVAVHATQPCKDTPGVLALFRTDAIACLFANTSRSPSMLYIVFCELNDVERAVLHIVRT
jgi:hypothetical protein